MENKAKERLVREAMNQASISIKEGNSPFGAVLSDEAGNIVLTAHNTTNTDVNPIAHAEINLIIKAANMFKTKNLSKFILVSNAQSCPMCFSAAIKAGINRFIFGCAEDETLKPKINVFELKERCSGEINIETNVLGTECLKQLREFRVKKINRSD